MNKSSTKAQEILYYSRGNEVMITDSGFKVKKTLYQLDGISGHSLSIISPARVPFVVIMVVGTIMFAFGAFAILPSSNSLVLALGMGVFVAGLLGAIRAREKYAVKIITAAGEKNVVVSEDHEYISQIVSALNRAYFDLTKIGSKK